MNITFNIVLIVAIIVTGVVISLQIILDYLQEKRKDGFRKEIDELKNEIEKYKKSNKINY